MSLFWEVALAAAKETETKESSFFIDFFQEFLLWIVAIMAFFLFIMLANIIKGIVVQRAIASAKYEIHEELLVLLGRAVYFSVVIIGAVVSFHIVGINFGAILGFLAVGIGFAFKDLIANIIAGVVILTQKKVKIGDLIKINGEIGKIQEIDVRTTHLVTLDGVLLIVPNAELLTNSIQNFTANTFRRICLQVGIHYSTPLADAIKLTLQVAKQNPKIVQEPATQVLATEFADSAIILDIRFWIESHGTNWPQVQSELIQAIKIAYDKAGITIPFPIRTISVDEFDGNLFKALKLPENRSSAVKPIQFNTISQNTE